MNNEKLAMELAIFFWKLRSSLMKRSDAVSIDEFFKMQTENLSMNFNFLKNWDLANKGIKDFMGPRSRLKREIFDWSMNLSAEDFSKQIFKNISLIKNKKIHVETFKDRHLNMPDFIDSLLPSAAEQGVKVEIRNLFHTIKSIIDIAAFKNNICESVEKNAKYKEMHRAIRMINSAISDLQKITGSTIDCESEQRMLYEFKENIARFFAKGKNKEIEKNIIEINKIILNII